MTVIHVLLSIESAFWKDGKVSQPSGKVVKLLVIKFKDNVLG